MNRGVSYNIIRLNRILTDVPQPSNLSCISVSYTTGYKNRTDIKGRPLPDVPGWYTISVVVDYQPGEFLHLQITISEEVLISSTNRVLNEKISRCICTYLPLSGEKPNVINRIIYSKIELP